MLVRIERSGTEQIENAQQRLAHGEDTDGICRGDDEQLTCDDLLKIDNSQKAEKASSSNDPALVHLIRA